MLKLKLFKGFALVVVIFSILSAFVGVKIIHGRVLDEAQKRVTLDLSSAWSVFRKQLDELETIMRMAAKMRVVGTACAEEKWDDPEVRLQLEQIRLDFDMDYLNLLSPKGQVMLRVMPPYTVGDYRTSDPTVASALKGEAYSCAVLVPGKQLQREASGLEEQAFLELEDTPRARKTVRDVETRGMVMEAAVPVMLSNRLVGVVYGGKLVNRNHDLIDRIHDSVYKDEKYKGVPVGTATIFLHDSRIATTVRRQNGNRALGTRVSKEVADKVLDNGKPWIGDAFVVDDWYISAYEPIRDGFGEIIGMLYVGILKKPFDNTAHKIAVAYVFLSLFVLAIALVVAFVLAGRLAQPIHRLVAASNSMSNGSKPPPVTTEHACNETSALIHAFNQMTEKLAEREEKLTALNKSYMEMLGFVSHELKSPVATVMNYVYLLREQKLGQLNEKQLKAVRAIDFNSSRLVEMVRHYLNLSRIENSELQPVKSRVDVDEEIVAPILESMEAELSGKDMRVNNDIGKDTVVFADKNMVREVFENLISNAYKYGREGGSIHLVSKQVDDYVEFRVRNEGEGIPPERMGELFKKFSRLEESDTAKKQKGTGLGLFITRNIVEAHGGVIRAESEPGEWTELIFTLPLYKNQKRKEDT